MVAGERQKLIAQRLRPLSQPISPILGCNLTFTYESAVRGYLRDRPLRVEMMHRDSINDLYIATFSMIMKQTEI